MKKLIKAFLTFIFIAISLSAYALDDLQFNKSEICNPGNYYWIIYDNVCPYCQNATKHIKQLDWEGKFKFISYRNPQTYKMFPFLDRNECEKDPHMVTPNGTVLKGYDVFKKVLDTLAPTKLLNPLFKNDFAEKQLQDIYEKMVAERSCYYSKTPTCGGEEHPQESTKH